MRGIKEVYTGLEDIRVQDEHIPERLLLAAVLERALRDYGRSDRRTFQDDRRQAEKWLRDRKTCTPFSVRHVCEELNIDFVTIDAALEQMDKEPRSRRSARVVNRKHRTKAKCVKKKTRRALYSYEEILRLHAQGFSMFETAMKVGCSWQTVKTYVRRAGLKPRYYNRDVLTQLVAQGLSLNEIAIRLSGRAVGGAIRAIGNSLAA